MKKSIIKKRKLPTKILKNLNGKSKSIQIIKDLSLNYIMFLYTHLLIL